MADALGIVVSLVALTYLPTVADPASYPKLLVLTAGGLALLPAVVHRWLNGHRPSGWRLLPCAAAVALFAWSTLAAMAADAPWPNRLFGWWLRADGLLAIMGAAILLVGAASLTSKEVRRTAIWLVGGALIAAVLAIPQLAGQEFMTPPPVVIISTLGQINFAGAYFAIMAIIALGLAADAKDIRLRVGWGLSAAVLAAMSYLTTSLQGPMAIAAGLLAFALAWAMTYRGPHRRIAIVSVSAVLVVGLAVATLGMLAIGPLGFIGREDDTTWRYSIWSAGWNILQSHPILGIGTGSLSRYFSEFRSLDTVVRVSDGMRPSAIHSIPLQFGIVGGWPALMLWITMFASTTAVLLVRLAKRSVQRPFVTAGIAGALGAYLAQAIVSIDTPSIIAVGWLVAGLAVALAGEPDVPVAPPVTGRGRRAAGSSESTQPTATSAPVWVPVVGAVLACVGGAFVWTQISFVQSTMAPQNISTLTVALADPMLPCAVRSQLVVSSLEGKSLDVALPAVIAATDVDPRCPPMVQIQSQVALQAGNLELADRSTSLGLRLDPQAPSTWQLRAQYLTQAGDAAGAASAQAQADRISSAIAGA